VLLGGDAVITGYVDRFAPAIDSGSHSIRVMGRGKCADLLDCAAEWPGGQISGASVLAIAQKLAEPYGNPDNAIGVRTDVADIGPVIPQFSLTLGTTAFEIIEQLCRYSALLAYDEPDGNLLLTRASTVQAASGFAQGINVQSASLTFSIDQRYSEVLGIIQAVDMFKDLGEGGNLQASVTDQNVPRHRRKIIVAEYGDNNKFDVLKKRTEWEVSRRSGRSRMLQLTTDSWRDSAGTLWTPNTLVDLALPSLKLPKAKWLISEVSFRRDGQGGTTADLVIMPPEAFDVQPIVFLPAPADVVPVAGK
jgi:prophage tail gpP-like protein